MISARIAGTGTAVPRRLIDTEDLLREAMPARDPARMARKIGIRTRGWISGDESTASLAAAALRSALDEAGMPAGALRHIILVNATGGDVMIPATANHVQGLLPGADNVTDAFDLNNACTGFLTGLDLAARLVATGSGPVGLAACEVFSRGLTPEMPREYVVFGDAAAAAVVVPSTKGGLVSSFLRNTAALRHEVGTPRHGRHTIVASAEVVGAQAKTWIRHASEVVLQAADVTVPALRYVLPHQPNGPLYRELVEMLGAREDQVVPVVDGIGSVGAVSVPFSLHEARRRGLVGGDRLLLAAVGAGTGYGALIWEEG